MTYAEELSNLLLRAKDLPLAIRQSLESDAEDFYENLIETAGEFLHNDLDVMGNDTPMQVIALVQVVHGVSNGRYSWLAAALLNGRDR